MAMTTQPNPVMPLDEVKDGWEVYRACSYAFAQRYAILELLCGKEEPFPDLQHESGFD